MARGMYGDFKLVPLDIARVRSQKIIIMEAALEEILYFGEDNFCKEVAIRALKDCAKLK